MASNDSVVTEQENYRVQPEDLEPTTNEACTEFQFKAIELRKQKPQWISYQKSEMLDKDDYELITRFDSNPTDRAKMLNNPNEKVECIKTLITIMNKLAKEINIQYVLTLMDDVLQESKQRVEIFHAYARKYKENIYSIFQKMLYNHDHFITNQTSRIIAKLACWSTNLMPDKDLRDYFLWATEQIDEKNPYRETLCRCLQMMLRIEHYRDIFYKIDGVKKLSVYLDSTLQKQGKDQIQYQITFCLWQLTFNNDIAQRIESSYTIIPLIADVLNSSEKEKVKRVILALFRNLLEKPESDISRANALCMLQFKVKKIIEIMQLTQITDEEIKDDIDYINKKLELLVNDVSSFDEYAAEVASGRLSWSPVHKSDKFWRENASRLNENNFYLIKQLIKLLKEETVHTQTLEIAAYDLGEYVRYYQRGKIVVEQFDGKSAVMALLTHDDQNVRHQALLCIQKLMVHNWEYLSKSAETGGSSSSQPSNPLNSKILESKA